MQETLEKILDHIYGIWNYRWYAVLCAWPVALGGWAVVSVIPNTYESSASIYVDTESVLGPLLRGITVDSIDFSEHLGMMTRELLSRPNLEKVVRKADLDLNVRTPAEMEALLARLTNDLQISATRTHRSANPTPPNLYIIAARNQDADTARRIVQSLLDTFLEDSIGGKRQDRDVAQRFLDQQIAEYEDRLLAAEQRLMEFRRAHIGSLPEQGSSFYQRLQMAQNRLEETELQLREESHRRDELLRQLQGTTPVRPTVGAGGAPVVSPLEQRLAAMQSRFDELRLRYTDQHPDVIEMQNTIAALESQRDAMAADEDERNLQSNPVYQQLRMALTEVEANIAAIEVRRGEHLRQVQSLRQQIEVLPQIEADLISLNRDYEVNKQNYDTLITRREAARVSEGAEETGEQIKFRVIEPPRTSLRPVSPNRPLLGTGVFVFAIGAGIGVAFLLSQLRPVFYTRRSLREITGIPVLAGVTLVQAPGMALRRRVGIGGLLLTGILLFAVYGAVVFMFLTGSSPEAFFRH